MRLTIVINMDNEAFIEDRDGEMMLVFDQCYTKQNKMEQGDSMAITDSNGNTVGMIRLS